MVKIWINDTSDNVIKLSDAQAYVLARIINNAISSDKSRLEDTDTWDFACVVNRLDEEANIPWNMTSDLDFYAQPKQ